MLKLASRLAGVVALIACITLLFHRLATVNETTAGFAYLLGVLAIASAWGLVEATVGSIVAVLCYNFFFLPPVGTFTIADPKNWVALLTFLITAIVASKLSDRAKRRTAEALERQRDMERLYALSRAILLTDASGVAARQITHQISQIFEVPSVALYERGTGEIHYSGPEDLAGVRDKLREAALQGTFFHDEQTRTLVTAVRLGGEPIGSLALRNAHLSETALQALTNLVAIALERVRSQESASRAEAARQSEELKSTLLDAIAHDFQTPLTSIKAAATTLLSGVDAGRPAGASEQRELLAVVDEEADRMSRLVTEAIRTSQIEAGTLTLDRRPHRVAEIIADAARESRGAAERCRVQIDGTTSAPELNVDADLIELALRQVIENALAHSPPGSPITIRAAPSGENLVISVSDQGPGIPRPEQEHLFDKFYRGSVPRYHGAGSGMGLAIARAILRSHGGDVVLESSTAQGSEFRLLVPLAATEQRS